MPQPPDFNRLNQRVANPAMETIKELKQLNEKMDRMLLLLAKIAGNTKAKS